MNKFKRHILAFFDITDCEDVLPKYGLQNIIIKVEQI